MDLVVRVNGGEPMLKAVIVVAISACAFALFGVIMSMRKDAEDKPSVYTCSDCGENDCLCHIEDGASW